MKYILSLIISGTLAFSGFGQTRNVLVDTNNRVVQPTNFWSADASNARAGLGLGTAATNAATAFQPASTALSNLSTGSFIIALTNGGTGATNTATARTNLGLGWSALTNTNAANFRNAIGLGVTNIPVFENGVNAPILDSSLNLVLDVENYGLYSAELSNTIIDFSGTNVVFRAPLLFFTNTHASASRTNLGLGWPALTNTDATNFRNAIGLGTTNDVVFNAIIGGTSTNNFIQLDNGEFNGSWSFVSAVAFDQPAQTRTNLGLPWSGLTNTNAATFQTALFGSNTNPVLVNTNGEVVSPTNFWAVAPISTTVQYQTNVTGTSTNAATNSRNLFLFSLSPSVSGITNTVTLPTNPATTFEGDRATIAHLANSTNAVTAIRQLGAATNLITLNQLDETVLLMYRSGAWRLADNISYVEPIFFSGTNAAANVAASRTNLGLGATWLTNNNVTNFRAAIGLGTTNDVVFNAIVGGSSTNNFIQLDNGEFNGLWSFTGAVTFDQPAQTRTNLGLGATWLTNTNVTNFRTAIGLGVSNAVIFEQLFATDTVEIGSSTNTIQITTEAIEFGHSGIAAATRTNLGIPLAALTNTNNANFQAAVFATNSDPTNAGNFNNHVAWMEVTVQTNGSNVSFRIPLYK